MVDPSFARYADLLQRLPELHDLLRQAGDVGELLARGTKLTCDECDYARGFVVGVRDGRLTADAIDPLDDPPSDRLRRQVLEDPVLLQPGTIESELVRRPNRPVTELAGHSSVLGEVLALERPTIGVIAPDNEAVGLLVVDRPRRAEVDPTDWLVVTLMGRMLAVVLEHVVLRARVTELASELRYLTVSVEALAREAFGGPITLPVHGRHLPAFAHMEGRTRAPEAVRQKLTAREQSIAALLAQGRSNPEIAEALFLSPETVKDNVARIIRKLGASNRVEAAVRFLGLGPETP